MSLRHADSARVQSWTWDLVGGERLVNIDKDTGISLRVESGSKSTRWSCGSGTSDLEVNTLRVVLSSIGLLSRVKSNDLVSENIVARGDVCWDGDRPRVVVGNQGIGSPVTGDGGVIVKSTSINLEPLKGGLVNS